MLRQHITGVLVLRWSKIANYPQVKKKVHK